MGLTSGALPEHWVWLSHLAYLLVLWAAVRRAAWRRLWEYRVLQHGMGLAVVSLMLLWQIRAGITPGLEIHFLGLTALTLAVGWSFAVIIASLALMGTTIVGRESLEVFSFNALVACVVPISVSYAMVIAERLARFRIFFAYIFVCAFFGGALAVVAAMGCMAWLLWFADVYSLSQITSDLLIYIPLIAFPEGVINGSVVTGLLVYLPQYLKTLDAERYGRFR